MAIGASQAGGTHQKGHAAVHSPLSAAAHHAASQVLAKLGLSSAQDLTRRTSDSVKVGSSHGKTVDSSQSKVGLVKINPEKMTAGSAHGSLKSDKSGASVLSTAKIHVSGVTAASVKEKASHVAKAKTTKLTGSDKTSIHVTGVSVHDLTKGGHGSGK
jgi:hypothetical protein